MACRAIVSNVDTSAGWCRLSTPSLLARRRRTFGTACHSRDSSLAVARRQALSITPPYLRDRTDDKLFEHRLVKIGKLFEVQPCPSCAYQA